VAFKAAALIDGPPPPNLTLALEQQRKKTIFSEDKPKKQQVGINRPHLAFLGCAQLHSPAAGHKRHTSSITSEEN
jgi:hypothetical protein